MRALKTIFLLALAAMTAGCVGSRVIVSVDSIAGPEAASKRTFIVTPGNPDVDEGSLLFKSFAAKLTDTLISIGFIEAPPEADPDTLVLLSYSVSDPKTETSTTSIPQFGQTGVMASNTYGSVSSSGMFSANTTYTPTYGVTGYIPVTETRVYFTRKATVAAYDFESSLAGNPKELWRTQMLSIGQSSDLRMIFSYMLEAATPFLGRDSGTVQEIEIPMKR